MLFGRSRCPIDRDTADWMADCVIWMFEQFDARALLEAELVVPTGDYLRRDGKTGHDLAEHVFEQVKELAGLPDWPCRIEAGDSDPEARVSQSVFVSGMTPAPAGTFQHRGTTDTVVITYNPGLLDDPVSLVATFAHELAHYLFAMSRTPPPGGEELEEFATDLGSVFLGFGIFAVNSSFRFEAHGGALGQGWGYRRSGYLSGNDLTYALALFLRLLDKDAEAAFTHLAQRYRGPLKASLRYLDRHPEIIERLGDATGARGVGGN
jgi:hypothetical protein